jgi:hypothetical protein
LGLHLLTNGSVDRIASLKVPGAIAALTAQLRAAIKTSVTHVPDSVWAKFPTNPPALEMCTLCITPKTEAPRRQRANTTNRNNNASIQSVLEAVAYHALSTLQHVSTMLPETAAVMVSILPTLHTVVTGWRESGSFNKPPKYYRKFLAEIGAAGMPYIQDVNMNLRTLVTPTTVTTLLQMEGM